MGKIHIIAMDPLDGHDCHDCLIESPSMDNAAVGRVRGDKAAEVQRAIQEGQSG
jgi:hypothetical protein